MTRIPIECIVEMKPNSIKPMRVRYEDREGAHVINVDNIVGRDKKKILPTMNIAASVEYSFKCETFVDEYRNSFTLVYNNQSCKWGIII